MELSGNLAEPVVSIGRNQGRQFLASHGNGQLSVLPGYEGNATNTDWPGIDGTTARGVTGATGSRETGCNWEIDDPQLNGGVSDRYYDPVDSRYNTAGGRCARTGPN